MATTKKTASKTTAVVPTKTPPATLQVANTALAAMFGNVPETPLQPLQDFGQGSSPYVTFVHPNAKNYAAVVTAIGAAQAKEGQVIYCAGQEITHLLPFQFIVCPMYYQYLAKYDGENNIVEAIPCPFVGRVPDDFKECLDAVLIIFLPDGSAAPARCSFRGPKCPAPKDAINRYIPDAALPDWAGRSKDHGTAAKLANQAWMRVVGTAQLTEEEPKKRDKGQKNYWVCGATFKPITQPQYNAIAAMLADDGTKKLMQDCMDEFKTRVEEIQGKMR